MLDNSGGLVWSIFVGFDPVCFLDAIEGRATDAATAEEGFWSVVVGAAAEESVRTGAPVAIAELLERDGIAALT